MFAGSPKIIVTPQSVVFTKEAEHRLVVRYLPTKSVTKNSQLPITVRRAQTGCRSVAVEAITCQWRTERQASSPHYHVATQSARPSARHVMEPGQQPCSSPKPRLHRELNSTARVRFTTTNNNNNTHTPV